MLKEQHAVWQNRVDGLYVWNGTNSVKLPDSWKHVNPEIKFNPSTPLYNLAVLQSYAAIPMPAQILLGIAAL